MNTLTYIFGCLRVRPHACMCTCVCLCVCVCTYVFVHRDIILSGNSHSLFIQTVVHYDRQRCACCCSSFLHNLGPHILVHCIAVNVFDSLCSQTVLEVVFFHLQTHTIFNKHTVHRTSKFHEWSKPMGSDKPWLSNKIMSLCNRVIK